MVSTALLALSGEGNYLVQLDVLADGLLLYGVHGEVRVRVDDWGLHGEHYGG